MKISLMKKNQKNQTQPKEACKTKTGERKILSLITSLIPLA